VKYVSTRGHAPALGFCDVLLAGLASDGGLYVPEAWPQLSRETIAGFAGKAYAEVAFAVIRPFVGGEIADGDLSRMCREAYAGFRHRAVAPLVQLGPGEWALELFHGPTLAFKDLAMHLLARLMDHVLVKRKARVTVIGATSGDTGGAAVEAFRGRDNADLFILFPEGRVSPIQQRQMTTTGAGNVHAIGVKGTFDDCQAIVKGLFNDRALRERLALAGVNSINWARIVAQIVYYVTAAVALGAPARAVSFTVPTGNFGDIFAGYAARRMGLPVDKLVIATNVNDILARTLKTGRYELRKVKATASPSMDIQVSSNFERLLLEAYGRDSAEVRRLMAELAAGGSFTIDGGPLAAIRADFVAGSADEAETAATIKTTYAETGFLADPHTAVGLAVARSHARPGVPMIALATAHPSKFPAAVEKASGKHADLPEGFGDLLSLKEDFAAVANDRAAVEQLLLARARAVREKV
jgi:threonine synthase